MKKYDSSNYTRRFWGSGAEPSGAMRAVRRGYAGGGYVPGHCACHVAYAVTPHAVSLQYTDGTCIHGQKGCILEEGGSECAGDGRGRVGEKSYIIWFVGSAVWWLDAALVLHRGSRSRALTSLAIAVVFFAAGMFFQRFSPKR